MAHVGGFPVIVDTGCKRVKWNRSPAKADEVGLLAAVAVGLRSTLRTTGTENILDGTEHILEEGSLGPEE